MTSIEFDIARVLSSVDEMPHDQATAIVKICSGAVEQAKKDALASICQDLKAAGYREAADWIWQARGNQP